MDCAVAPVTPAQARTVARIQAELARLVRYDDESIVHETWIRQRYDLGVAASYAPARVAAVLTAWHEAGHAVAALAVGARFSSASIRHGSGTQGRVHGIHGDGDDELRAWLPTWRADGGDARRFRRGIAARFGDDEVAAWRHCEQALIPHRPRIRQVARALLVHPRHLPYPVVAAVAAGA